ncbi:hypothetical protein [Streptomyces sp. BRA346]|uniref:hypothetical protein n=1 Tax=Streptomyces sp. BRA346 TaxID=2878199 RepID=UPI004062E67A
MKLVRVVLLVGAVIGALVFGGAADGAETHRWRFPGSGSDFIPFPGVDDAGSGSRCVNQSSRAGAQQNDCDTRHGGIETPNPAAGGKPIGPVPKPV